MYRSQIETERYLDQLDTQTSRDHFLVDVPQALSPFLGMQILQNWVDAGHGSACMVVPRPHLVPEMIDVATHMGINAVSAEQSEMSLNREQVRVVSLRMAISNMSQEGCLVFFDSDQCADELVNLFSLSIPSYSYLYDEVRELLDPSWPVQSDQALEVMSENWIRQADHVKTIIRDYEAFNSLAERFKLLEDIFSSCRCHISFSAITIAATEIPKRKMGVLASAQQRIFLVPLETDCEFISDVFGDNNIVATAGFVQGVNF